MQEATAAQRPWVTAGVALTAASMVAVAPIVGPTLPEVQFPDIQLTDFVGQTADNITNLVDYFAGVQPGYFLFDRVAVGAPFPILQQIVTNQINNLGGVLDGTRGIGDVAQSMVDNLGAGLLAPLVPFDDVLATGGPLEVFGLGSAINPVVEDLIRAVLGGIPDLNRNSLLDGVLSLDLASILGLDPSREGLLDALLGFTGSPASGLLLGVLGPVLGPLMALSRGLGEVFDGGDTAALLGIPGNMINAFLNGGETLDLAPVLDLLGINPSIDVNLGILGDITGGLDDLTLELGGVLGGPGSIFNALSMEAGLFYQGPCVPIFGCPNPIGGGATMVGGGAGPIGSLLAGQNSIADAINDGPLVNGLLTTITNGLGLDPLTDGLDTVRNFLIGDLLNPVTGVLGGLTDDLAAALTNLLGSDLGVAALGDMVFNIPALLLTMML